jgi:tRNA-specific 2-thiouridylase
MKSSKPTVFIGLSGGVDSCVSAYLLQKAGYQVEGLFMKNWEEDDTSDYCSSEQDLKDIRMVCKSLDIPLHTVNFAQEYWQSVFNDFLEEYKAGRTPNPDILCNREIKFKHFLNHALNLGADYIATGHYIKKLSNDIGYTLHKACDLNKDQSYFLYTLNQAQLQKSLFPLADLTKPQVREIARNLGLVTHSKKDSTGLCFIGERKFKPFLADFINAKPGLMQTPEGKNVGEHDGIMFYTLGQRQGLKIGGQKEADTLPWYVVAKNVKENILVVAQGNEHPWHFCTELTAKLPSWIEGAAPSTLFKAQAKTRYRQADEICEVCVEDNGLSVKFENPQRSVTPGQSLVLYQGDKMLGGAIIEATNSEGGIS